MSIVILNGNEEIQRFLDPELLDCTEKINQYGLRTIELSYTFQDYLEDKELFKQGNKIWISDTNLSDCLYVINTKVEEDIYDENSFKVDAEEVLVELNYAPVFSQTELSADNGFTITTLNGRSNVTVNWNALEYWFGQYFNIGIVQDCLNNLVSHIPITGTVNRMDLLRSIEEQTGNIFITRYEKDELTNTIHRYLDFLNPQSDLKNWELNLEYDFVAPNETMWYQGNPADEDDEDIDPEDDPQLIPDEEVNNDEDSLWYDPDKVPAQNVNPETLQFQIRDPQNNIIEGKYEPVVWNATDVGLDDESDVIIQLIWDGEAFGVAINNKSYAVSQGEGYIPSPYVETWTEVTEKIEAFIPDGSFFVMCDTSNDTVLFSTELNYRLGTAHNEVLHFSENVENIAFEYDEAETYKAMAPLIEDSNNEFTVSELNGLISKFKGLEVNKGDLIPLTLEKVNVEGTSLQDATNSLGEWDLVTNYFSRPIKPNDNTGSTPKSFEFYKATSYARSPFTKRAGSFNVIVDEETKANYTEIKGRPDTRKPQGTLATEKAGTVTTSDDEIYLIYQKIVESLQEKRYPSVVISVDVAQLKNKKYNNYQLWDKIYVKIPGNDDLVTARVSQVEKDLHTPANNKISLDNYSILQTAMQHMTYIEAENATFDFEITKTITATLFNADYVPQDPYSVENPSNQMITLKLYHYENNKSKLYQVYNKITDAYGKVNLDLKLDPGDYDLKIDYFGDEEYLDTSLTIKLNVTGSKSVESKKKKNKSKSKTTKKSKSSHKNSTEKKRYYSKYGVSPNKNFILAIGKRSVSADSRDDGIFYETQFRNRCPRCGRSSLIYGYNWAGNKDKGKFKGTGTVENNSTKGMIFCTHCSTRYSVLGNEELYAYQDALKLTITTKTKKSNAVKANQLIKGKTYYDSIWVKNKSKSVAAATKWPRNHSNGLPKMFINIAKSIVGDKTGLDAAELIARWCNNKIYYQNYAGFKHKPDWVYKHKKANCCDATRLMLALWDASGVMDTCKLKWVRLNGVNGSYVFAKIKNKNSGRWRYVDPCYIKPWGNYDHFYGETPGQETVYKKWGDKPRGM